MFTAFIRLLSVYVLTFSNKWTVVLKPLVNYAAYWHWSPCPSPAEQWKAAAEAPWLPAQQHVLQIQGRWMVWGLPRETSTVPGRIWGSQLGCTWPCLQGPLCKREKSTRFFLWTDCFLGAGLGSWNRDWCLVTRGGRTQTAQLVLGSDNLKNETPVPLWEMGKPSASLHGFPGFISKSVSLESLNLCIPR